MNGNVSEKQEFIRDFANKIAVNQAGVFVGSGMSKDAGFPDWKNLVKLVATDIELRLQPNMQFDNGGSIFFAR